MDKKTTDRLLLIASVLLLIAGAILLCVSIFGQSETTFYLAWASACILLANLFNIIRRANNKSEAL